MSTTPDNRYFLSGTTCCLVSAVAYTAANVCMRQLTVLRCDPVFAVFSRELVTTLLVVPWLIASVSRGRPTMPSGRSLVTILLVGILLQIVANLCWQWALGIVGLAVTIPIQFGVSITSGAIMGSLLLRERVTIRSASAIVLLILAIVLLAMGAETVGRAIAPDDAPVPGSLWIALAVGAVGLAGAIVAATNIVIRHSVTRTTPPCALAFLIPLMGVLVVGPIAVQRLGVPAMLNASVEEYLFMGIAGVFNLVGFLGLIYGLQRTTVVHANAICASQVAIAAVAGLALFHEPPTLRLLVGVGLTIVGILWIDRPETISEPIQI